MEMEETVDWWLRAVSQTCMMCDSGGEIEVRAKT